VIGTAEILLEPQFKRLLERIVRDRQRILEVEHRIDRPVHRGTGEHPASPHSHRPGQNVRPRTVMRNMSRRQIIAVSSHIEHMPVADLFQIGEALGRERLLPRLVQRRQQHRRENRYDCDYNEQLNKSKMGFHDFLLILPLQSDFSIQRNCGLNC